MSDKTVKIDKANDVSAFASKDGTRPVLSGIHFGTKYTEATNGRMAIRVPYVENATPHFLGNIVPNQLVKRMVSGSQEAVVSKAESGRVKLEVSDLVSTQIVEVTDNGLTFPNLDNVFPGGPAFKNNEPKAKICLPAVFLQSLAKWASDNSKKEPGIVFEIRGPLDPVSFSVELKDGREAVGVLMPTRNEKALK